MAQLPPVWQFYEGRKQFSEEGVRALILQMATGEGKSIVIGAPLLLRPSPPLPPPPPYYVYGLAFVTVACCWYGLCRFCSQRCFPCTR